jgi:hypothetical protein
MSSKARSTAGGISLKRVIPKSDRVTEITTPSSSWFPTRTIAVEGKTATTAYKPISDVDGDVGGKDDADVGEEDTDNTKVEFGVSDERTDATKFDLLLKEIKALSQQNKILSERLMKVESKSKKEKHSDSESASSSESEATKEYALKNKKSPPNLTVAPINNLDVKDWDRFLGDMDSGLVRYTKNRPTTDGDLQSLIKQRSVSSSLGETTKLMSIDLTRYIYAQLRILLSVDHKEDIKAADKEMDGLLALKILDGYFRPKIIAKEISSEQEKLLISFYDSGKTMDQWLKMRSRARSTLGTLQPQYVVPDVMQVNELLSYIKGVKQYEDEYKIIHGQKSTIAITKCEELLRAAEDRMGSPRHGVPYTNRTGAAGRGGGGVASGAERKPRWQRDGGRGRGATGAVNVPATQESAARPCYRCGRSNHKIAECKVPKHVQCKTCSLQGHTTGVCTRTPIGFKKRLDEEAKGKAHDASRALLTEMAAKMDKVLEVATANAKKRKQRSDSVSSEEKSPEPRRKKKKNKRRRMESDDEDDGGETNIIQSFGTILPRVMAVQSLGRDLRRHPLYMLLDTCADNHNVGPGAVGITMTKSMKKTQKYVLGVDTKNPVRVIGIGKCTRRFDVTGSKGKHSITFDKVQIIEGLDAFILSTKQLEAQGYVLTEGIAALRTPVGTEIPVYRLDGFPAIKSEDLVGRVKHKDEGEETPLRYADMSKHEKKKK